MEGQGFKDLMKYVEPGYTVPSRKHIGKLLKHRHSLSIEKLKEKLDKEAESVALTTDIWTSVATEAYITVTAHYFEKDWKIQSFVLQTPAFPERHTGTEIANKVKEICDNFRISEKVSYILHDQAANMMCSLDILESERGWERLNCAAHTLQLCLKSGFELLVISRLLAAARKLVGHFHHSVVSTESLKTNEYRREEAY